MCITPTAQYYPFGAELVVLIARSSGASLYDKLVPMLRDYFKGKFGPDGAGNANSKWAP
jgi:hypothetical protein